MDRLSPLDAAFLEVEDADPHASLAIASVAVVEGPAPGHDEFLGLMRSKLPVLPRARQKLVRRPLDLATPMWEDDPSFDLDYHVRRTALPAPGGDAELCALVARVMGQRLDRDRPLWEYWVVEGLADGRWAILAKVHHCMADGVSGTMLYDVMYGDAPAPEPPGAARPESLMSLLANVVRAPLDLLGGMLSLVWSLLPVRATSLFGQIGSPRLYRVVRASLPEVKEIGRSFGVTVNDVVLAAISQAYRALLLERGEEPSPHSVRAMVPVSVRGDRRLDNHVSLRLAFLPVEADHAVDALDLVHQRFTEAKGGHQAESGQTLAQLARHEPFAPLAWSVRLGGMMPQRSIVTVTTNVPGPRRPLRVLGRAIVEILPYVPIAIRIRTGIAVLSYTDRVAVGITADRDSTADVDVLAEALDRAIAELLTASRRDAAARRPG
ncbi:wax ester/triacylglycerol synthase family O-acyltransferase [Lentzea sp. HUAS12]|uniref:wax ester/triacylglycerol synthase family O-acyltransferase n=1 Tax=Lentzea sp. HUAS12 TaxID=2951806 RepID=UPI00209E263F|nr:wax ester/triacylglycerol synthase family O-acyltransferase [Lentzea sp. HUAS12]USX54516.1 wax ester/triacylglycerol synthase family O-acyltransferase [Lentzea sp. HUAS12]